MATLAQLSQIDSTRGQGALAILLSDDPFIRHLEQVSGWEEDATDFDYPTVDGDADVQTRSRGGAYDSDGEVPQARISGSLAFHGDSFTVDRSDLADAARGLRDLPKWIEGKITKKVKKWARKFSVKLWQGSGADGNIKGLVKIIDGATDLPGYAGYKGVIDARDYTAGADYLDLTNKDNWGAFYRLVIQAVSEVENPTGMSMNKELFGLVQTIAKEYGTKGETRDLFGTIVPAWDSSIPFIRLLDGCITNTEPDGDDVAHCTSLFIHSFAQEDFSLLTNSGLDWKDFDWMESKESGKFIWEVRAQWKPALPQKVLRVMKLKVK